MAHAYKPTTLYVRRHNSIHNLHEFRKTKVDSCLPEDRNLPVVEPEPARMPSGWQTDSSSSGRTGA